MLIIPVCSHRSASGIFNLRIEALSSLALIF
jgi:hypothetical protein